MPWFHRASTEKNPIPKEETWQPDFIWFGQLFYLLAGLACNLRWVTELTRLQAGQAAVLHTNRAECDFFCVVVAEWLRRWTRNPLGSPRAGSNPADYGEEKCPCVFLSRPSYRFAKRAVPLQWTKTPLALFVFGLQGSPRWSQWHAVIV